MGVVSSRTSTPFKPQCLNARFLGRGSSKISGSFSSIQPKWAKANQIDLIMMPTHGYGRFRALLLGSVTAKVLHDADCPVWTAVHREEVMAHPPETASEAPIPCWMKVSAR